MSKKLFLVLGPESSGNHLTSMILKKMGCYWEEPQKLDNFKDEEELNRITYNNPNIVLRRSVPHGREWCNPLKISQKFEKYGFKMYTIVLQREWMATMLSNYYHRSSNLKEAWKTLEDAEKHIAGYMATGVIDPFYVLNTSSLMKDPKPAIRGLEIFTGLRWPDGMPYESFVYDSDIGRHSLLLEHGFIPIDRMIHKKYITRPRPPIKR